MPWCDDCAKFWNPPSMGEGGECPTCGRVLVPPAPPSDLGPHEDEDLEGVPRAPWHFKLLLVAMTIYLGYRAIQGVAWLAHHL
jgi:hypothetical protein